MADVLQGSVYSRDNASCSKTSAVSSARAHARSKNRQGTTLPALRLLVTPQVSRFLKQVMIVPIFLTLGHFLQACQLDGQLPRHKGHEHQAQYCYARDG